MCISHPLPLYFSGVMTFSIVRFSGEASYKFHFGTFHSFMRGGEEATVFPTTMFRGKSNFHETIGNPNRQLKGYPRDLS